MKSRISQDEIAELAKSESWKTASRRARVGFLRERRSYKPAGLEITPHWFCYYTGWMDRSSAMTMKVGES